MRLSKRKIIKVIIVVVIYFVFSFYWCGKQYMYFKLNEVKKKSISTFLNNINDINTLDLINNSNTYVIDYIAVLEIPKINLKQGLMQLDSKYNDVNYNIAIHELSDMPKKEGGNFILMAHSGSSRVSYFQNLDDLILGDEVIVYYDNKKYIYIVSSIYEEEKIGKINIDRDINQTTLTMTTCSNNDEDKQLIIISYLNSICG